MNREMLNRKAKEYLNDLCFNIPTRRVGSQGNRDATRFFREEMDRYGLSTKTQSFDCIDMRLGEIHLRSGNREFEAFISPYSTACDVNAPLTCASTIGELESIQPEGKILLLHGEIAKEQLMPKNFVFYNPAVHQRIYALLESKKPAAVVTATSKNPDAVGAIYPFPMIEDGDFHIPTAYMTDIEGKKLLAHDGEIVTLTMDTARIPSRGENVVAKTGRGTDRRMVICAHIDAKEGTPGALDNASGVTILMLLAHLLQDYQGRLGVELVALNGEEYYSAPGQMAYLKENEGQYGSILLAVNLDDIGYFKDRTAYSLYGVPDALAGIIRNVFSGREGFLEGSAWYQSDHGIFITNGIPAMAVTEESFTELLAKITHSEKDIPDIVDSKKLVENAFALCDLIIALNQEAGKTGC